MSTFPSGLAEAIVNAKVPPRFAESKFGRLLIETVTGKRDAKDTAAVIVNEISKTDLYNGGPKKIGGAR